MGKQRIAYIDALKGLTILWVVLYHIVSSNGVNDIEFINAPFRMPLFFMLSGFFFRETASFKEYFVKKFNTLIVPFFFFFILGYVFKFCIMQKGVILGEKESSEVMSEFVATFLGSAKIFTLIPADTKTPNPLGVGAIWFLVGLFLIQLTYYGLRKISKSPWFLVAISLGFYYLYTLYFKEHYASGSLLYSLLSMQYLIYYIIGHLFMGRLVKYLNSSLKQKLLLVCITVIIIITLPYLLKSSVFVLEAILLSIISISFFSMTKESSIIVRLLSYFGKSSLIILGLHMLFMSLFKVIIEMCLNISPSSFIFVVIEFILVALCCIPAKIILEKYFPKFVGKQPLIG